MVRYVNFAWGRLSNREKTEAPRQRWLAPPVWVSPHDLVRCSDEELLSHKVFLAMPLTGFRLYAYILPILGEF